MFTFKRLSVLAVFALATFLVGCSNSTTPTKNCCDKKDCCVDKNCGKEKGKCDTTCPNEKK